MKIVVHYALLLTVVVLPGCFSHVFSTNTSTYNCHCATARDARTATVVIVQQNDDVVAATAFGARLSELLEKHSIRVNNESGVLTDLTLSFSHFNQSFIGFDLAVTATADKKCLYKSTFHTTLLINSDNTRTAGVAAERIMQQLEREGIF